MYFHPLALEAAAKHHSAHAFEEAPGAVSVEALAGLWIALLKTERMPSDAARATRVAVDLIVFLSPRGVKLVGASGEARQHPDNTEVRSSGWAGANA